MHYYEVDVKHSRWDCAQKTDNKKFLLFLHLKFHFTLHFIISRQYFFNADFTNFFLLDLWSFFFKTTEYK